MFDFDRVQATLRSRQLPVESALESGRSAAVAAVVRQFAGREETLLIRRAQHEQDPWSGHMAFPGGRRDHGDASLLHTALRETLEEVGLDLQRDAKLLGALEPIEAVARGKRQGFIILPFVFLLHAETALHLHAAEVAEAVWAPLADLHSGALDTTMPHQQGTAKFELPAFDIGGRLVWGLTHRMLLNLLSLARDIEA